MTLEEIDRVCDLYEPRLRAGEALSVEQFLLELDLPPDDELVAELRVLEQEYGRQGEARLAATLSDSRLDVDGTTQAIPGASIPDDPDKTPIGGYTLVRKLGEGGMGMVYLAEQTAPVARRVALKIIKPGMDSRQVIARFAAERQALALMDHPNIARVFDAGETPDGRPYFVMELVQGVPITRFCDERRFTVRERLELFIPVCQAVQHSHLKGIIHRDLKPSNVLVTEFDGRPVPRVIDFGLAKAISRELSDEADFTQIGQILGTIAYMSPEQAACNSADIDTRTDVYSLGVLLYELLAGDTPFDRDRLRRARFDELLRIIRDEEPPRPSVRIGSQASLSELAARRRTEPARLSHLVRGDLDWIVMKALEKDRARRYESASGLAIDVQRHLCEQPVSASPPSRLYRLHKFARRNRRVLTAAGVVLGGLAVAGGSLAWSIHDRAARTALAQQERDDRRNRFTSQVELILDEVQQWEGRQDWPEALAAARRAQSVAAGGEVTPEVRELVRQVLRDLEFVGRLEEIRMLKAEWREDKYDDERAIAAYAAAFRDFGVDLERLTADEVLLQLKAHSHISLPLALAIDDYSTTRWMLLRKSDDFRQTLITVSRALDPDPVRDHLRAAWLRDELEERQAEVRALTESLDLASQSPATLVMIPYALEWVELHELVEPFLRSAQQHHPDEFWINFHLALRLSQRQDLDGAVRFYSTAIGCRPEVNAPYNNLANTLRKQNKLDEAEAWYRRAIEIDPTFSLAYLNLGRLLDIQNRLDEAEAYLRRAIDLAPGDAAAHAELGSVLSKQKRPDDALSCVRRAVELGPDRAVAHFQMGNVLRALKRPGEAEVSFRRAIELEPAASELHFNLGNALREQRKLSEAEFAYRRATELDPNLAGNHNGLGGVLHEQNKLAEAEASFRRAIELDADFALAHSNLGIVLAALAQPAESETSYRKGIELDPSFAPTHYNLGNLLYRQRRLAEAEASYLLAIQCDSAYAEAHANLGNVLRDSGRPDEAEASYRRAVELNPRLAPPLINLRDLTWSQRKSEAALEAADALVKLQPRNGQARNVLAWFLVTCPEENRRDAPRAIELASRALQINPKGPGFRNTLGVAHFRAGHWQAAIDELSRSIEQVGENAGDGFFLAMAHWQLGRHDEAREWFDKSIAWTEKNAPSNQEILQFQAEAAALLGTSGSRLPKP